VTSTEDVLGRLVAPLGDRGRKMLLDGTTLVLRGLQRVSFGRLGNSIPFGPPVVWITTQGRKSGLWRQNPLVAVREHDRPDAAWIVTGTNAGQAKTPAWVFNARSNQHGYLTDRSRHWRVRLQEATGADADALFSRLEARLSWFTSYRERLDREVPVFRIIPLDEVSAEDLPSVGDAVATADR
jgi:deazaflavin-dependent oxidoreductase (nitroreductase family)